MNYISEDKFSLKSFSWKVISPSVFIKTIDKSALHNNGTGIPMDIRRFFLIDDMSRGEVRDIVLAYNDNEYEARIELDIQENPRSRIIWRHEFADLLREKFSSWYSFFKGNATKEPSERPKIRFERIQPNYYGIEFVYPNSIYTDAEEEQRESPLIEGRTRYYTSKVYERNPANREKAIEIHGTKCVICGFDFEEHYGERGKGYIEVHHVNPLSTLEEEVVINPVTDLMPVCSNCHKMIHRERDNVLSIEEMREIYKGKET